MASVTIVEGIIPKPGKDDKGADDASPLPGEPDYPLPGEPDYPVPGEPDYPEPEEPDDDEEDTHQGG